MRGSILTSALMFLAALPAAAQAQIKLPVFDEPKGNTQNVSFQDASDGGYHHGNWVRIVRNDDLKNSIDGVVVRTDRKKGVIYVRTKPNMAPRAIAVSDIKRIDKGVIQNVGFSKDVTTPEISEFAIFNGARRTVSYIAPTLSPGEIDQLHYLQSEENEMARLDTLANLEVRSAQEALAIQSSRREAREIGTEYLWQYLVGRFRNRYDETPIETQAANPGYGYPYSYGYANPNGGQSIVFDRTRDDSFPRTLAAILQADPPTLPSKELPGRDTLTTARRQYLAARNHAVYEDGHLVAVVVGESPPNAR